MTTTTFPPAVSLDELSSNIHVDGDSWTMTRSGDGLSLSEVIAFTVRDPSCADRFFIDHRDAGENDSFREFMKYWFGSDSEPVSLAEAAARTKRGERDASEFHTSRWVGGKKGKTFAQIIEACQAAGTTIDRLVQVLIH